MAFTTHAAVAQIADNNALKSVRLDQRLGITAPIDLEFVDEHDRPATIRTFAGGRPIVLVPTVYSCSMLCGQVMGALTRAVPQTGLIPARDFDLIVFTLDPRETPEIAADKKAQYLRRAVGLRNWTGWHFLTGNPAHIETLTNAIGYHYSYEPATNQFAHPAAIAVLTADGTISRYLVGVDYGEKDLKLALLEAGQGKVGSFVDRVILRCYQYDPTTSKYGLAVTGALRAGGAITVATLIAGVFHLNRRRRALLTRSNESAVSNG
jgi:protein SCO1/2